MKNDNSELDANEASQKGREDSPELNGGLFSQSEPTPDNEQLDGGDSFSGKQGGPLNKRTRSLNSKPLEKPKGLPLRDVNGETEGQKPDEETLGDDLSLLRDQELSLNAEDAPSGEPGSPDDKLGGLFHKVTTSLGISHSSEEDSPGHGDTETFLSNTSPLKRRTGPFAGEPSEKETGSREGDSQSSLGRLEELSADDEDELKKKQPTTGPLGKRQTGPIYRKRQTGPLVLPNMDLDSDKPAEEEGWLKSVTGTLLGREEPKPVSADESSAVTSRLESLEKHIEPQQPEDIQKPAEPIPPIEEPSDAEQPHLFLGEEKQATPDGDAEFQAFLEKLKQVDQDKDVTPGPNEAKTAKLPDLPGSQDTTVSQQAEVEPDKSVFKLSPTKPLGALPQEEESTEPQSPFIMDGDFDGLTAESSLDIELPGKPEVQEDLFQGGIDTTAWDLPPEIQALIQKQKEGSSESAFLEELPETQEPLTPTTSEQPPTTGDQVSESIDEQLFPWNLESSQPEKTEEKTAETDSDGYEFGALDFLSSEESAPSEGETSFDSGGAFDFLSKEEQETPQPETSGQESYDFGAFDFLKTPEETTKPEEGQENASLIGGIEPPSPDYFYQAPEEAEAEGPVLPRKPYLEEEPFPDEERVSPFTGLTGAPAEPEMPVEADLRAMFDTEDSFAAQEMEPISEADQPPDKTEEAEPEKAAPKFKLTGQMKLLITLGALAISFTMVVILAIIVIVRSNLIPMPVTPPPQPATSQTTMVQVTPTGLELTGGWTFYLTPAELKDGVWVPKGGPEWLNGTELRRVVGLPWNPQLDAVVQTLKDGDPVRLLMSNNDIVMYRVEKVEKVQQDEVEILGGNTPGLVVVFYRQDNGERWVVVCHQ